MKELQEKLQSQGAESLSDQELLAFLLGDEVLVKQICEHYHQPLTMLCRESIARLRMVGGMGLHSAQRIAVASEWGRRCVMHAGERVDAIGSSGDVVKIFRPQLGGLKHEECWVLYLNNSNRILEQRCVSRGGIDSTVIDQRLIIKRALELLATQLIIVHNHPSGSVTPSHEDLNFTPRVRDAAKLFDIDLVDHIIISYSDHYSLRSAGEL